MNMDYKNNPVIPYFFALVCLITAYTQISFLLGSTHSYLGLFSQILTVSGCLFAATPLAFILGNISLIKWFTVGTLTALKLPTILATLGWFLTTQKTTVKIEFAKFLLFVLFPVTCMALFITHSIAGQVPLYACYWLIPITIYAIQKFTTVSTFFTALQITFIAHATGSIIWLYSVPMTTTQWNSLLFIVAIERITFALITTLFLSLLVQLQKKSLRWLKFITFLKGVAHGNFNI